jgi:heme-degrading monooxygenase HmoA
VYARSTTVTARPGSIDAGVEHVRDHVMPALPEIDGCLGLSLLVADTPGRCIVTTAWCTEEAMHAGAERLRPHHDRMAELLGGTPEDEEWEIAVLHRDHTSPPGACVRTVWVRVEPPEADREVDLYRSVLLPEIAGFEGFCSTSLLVDRTDGYAVSSITFENREAMRRTRRLAAVVRDPEAGEASGEILEVGEFELALAHLRVPEVV